MFFEISYDCRGKDIPNFKQYVIVFEIKLLSSLLFGKQRFYQKNKPVTDFRAMTYSNMKKNKALFQ